MHWKQDWPRLYAWPMAHSMLTMRSHGDLSSLGHKRENMQKNMKTFECLCALEARQIHAICAITHSVLAKGRLSWASTPGCTHNLATVDYPRPVQQDIRTLRK